MHAGISKAQETREIIADEVRKAVEASLTQKVNVCGAERAVSSVKEKSTSFFAEADELSSAISQLEEEFKALYDILSPILKNDGLEATGCFRSINDKDSVIVQIMTTQSNRVRGLASGFASLRNRIQFK